jgi:hypothetical protein
MGLPPNTEQHVPTMRFFTADRSSAVATCSAAPDRTTARSRSPGARATPSRRCGVLEHLSKPSEALGHLYRVLKPGGTITVIAGDHGSAYFHPESPSARKAIQCLIQLQARSGGDSRRLYPLLLECGFRHVSVSPRMVYVDSSHPKLVEGFTRNTFTARSKGFVSGHWLLD